MAEKLKSYGTIYFKLKHIQKEISKRLNWEDTNIPDNVFAFWYDFLFQYLENDRVMDYTIPDESDAIERAEGDQDKLDLYYCLKSIVEENNIENILAG